MDQLLSLGLTIDMICPSHGVIWRERPMEIVEKYRLWADAYQRDQVTIVYDTMWQSTRLMAQAIADGIRQTSPSTTVKLFNITKEDKNDVLTEVFHSKAVLIGSPTINNGISFATAGILEMMVGMKLRNKKGAAFGSFGWSGEAVKIIDEHLNKAGIETGGKTISLKWVPDNDMLQQCVDFGKAFAESLK